MSSHALLEESESKALQGLRAKLVAQAEKASSKPLEISRDDVAALTLFIEKVLATKPLIFDETITPNEASEIAGVSRPMIMEMLKTGTLVGFKVGSHFKVKRDSLIKYIKERESAYQAMSAMDEDGFGVG